uniref:Rho-GAP domain-containing protein n=1 Tax=Plectus sambesii TaxID=2011161 RepID=A0A914UT45_9BILA
MERVREGMQKRVRRFQQLASQNVGLTEKKDELQAVSHVDQRTQRMIAAVKNTRHNLGNCLRTGSKDELMDKRKRRLEDYHLAHGLQSDAKELEAVSESSLLADIMRSYADALSVLVDERVQTDMEIEKKVLESLGKYQEDERGISKIKEKLTKAVLDMESNRRRLQTAPPEKFTEIQEEFDATQYKVDSYKDNAIADLFTLAAKEVEIASTFSLLVEIQAEYHRTAIRTLENVLPEITRKIATYGKRPVFGCPLEDHLRYSHRKIALVLEVCCSALCVQGLTEEGLFRISGNATKVRRLKAGFDAHEFDLLDYVNDPHSLAGVLKCYLRELPEPLMGHNMHNEWVRAGRLDGEERKAAMRDILSVIPAANRDNLAYLIKFLQRLLVNEEHTRMSASNISIVMGPNLIGNAGEGDNMLGSRLVETLLVNADYFFPQDIDFKSDYTRIFAGKFADETGGFEASDRMPPKSTQQPTRHEERPQNFNASFDTSGSNAYTAAARNVSPNTHRNHSASGMGPPQQVAKRPKQPAPPPPPSGAKSYNDQRPISSGEYDNVSPPGHPPPAAMSQSLIDLDSEIGVSKSPSVHSNDSMNEYALDAPNALRSDCIVDYEPPKPARRTSPSLDSIGSLPEDPPQNSEKEKLASIGRAAAATAAAASVPIRPPPPTQTALDRNATSRDSGRGRPVSYMNAVTSVEVNADANGNQQPHGQAPIRPPIAPRRTHMKTASVDENRTVLTINDGPVSPDSSKPRPPIPAKPPRNIDEPSITKL